jgi:hypothetical protein
MYSKIITNPRLRSFARRCGLTKLKLLRIKSTSYEEKFSKFLLSSINEGDIVWDVGANIGITLVNLHMRLVIVDK